MPLQEFFLMLVQKYCPDALVPGRLWNEISQAYAHHNRHYHTLAHLENLLAELDTVKSSIQDHDAVLFALYYHDIVYHVRESDNEEKSAELAVARLEEIQVPGEKISLCRQHILATKQHTVSENPDTNLFTDADLSILGKDWPAYENYFRQVRKEYAIYPDLLYKPGRRKVLEHFLAMERIFKTGVFFERYEKNARENMKRELELLR